MDLPRNISASSWLGSYNNYLCRARHKFRSLTGCPQGGPAL